MLKKTITYKDFNDEEQSEDFFFHLSMNEVIKLEVSQKGGLQETLLRLADNEDGVQIMEIFNTIILNAYGKKSEDGKRFIKNDALRQEFEESPAYDALFSELVLNAEKAAEFVNGIVPKDMAEQAQRLAGADLKIVPDPKPEARVITQADIVKMSGDEAMQLSEKIRTGEVVLGPEPTT